MKKNNDNFVLPSPVNLAEVVMVNHHLPFHYFEYQAVMAEMVTCCGAGCSFSIAAKASPEVTGVGVGLL